MIITVLWISILVFPCFSMHIFVTYRIEWIFETRYIIQGYIYRNDGTILFFSSFFFFSKEDLINHSIQYVQRGAISRWYYSFFFFFFPFSKEPCNGGFISMHHFIFFIGRAYNFAVFFCAPLFSLFFLFFLFFFVSRNAIFLLFFSLVSLYKGTV